MECYANYGGGHSGFFWTILCNFKGSNGSNLENIAPALDLMACLPSRLRREAINEEHQTTATPTT